MDVAEGTELKLREDDMTNEVVYEGIENDSQVFARLVLGSYLDCPDIREDPRERFQAVYMYDLVELLAIGFILVLEAHLEGKTF